MEKELSQSEVAARRAEALRLLDSATAGGALTVEQSELHVVHVLTHCYKQSVIDTVIQGNVNVIDELERDWEAVSKVLE